MWQLAHHEFESRIVLDSGAFHTLEHLSATQRATQSELCIGRLRPPFPAGNSFKSLHNQAKELSMVLMPSTSGCNTPEDAVATAHLAVERLKNRLIGLHIEGCSKSGFPDGEGTLEAARELLQSGFEVIPVCSDDPVLCQRLAEMGCAAVMVLGASPGTAAGIQNPDRIALIRSSIDVPMILTGGFGSASDVMIGMELGADAVVIGPSLLETNLGPQMVQALHLAAQAGRASYEAIQNCTNGSETKKGTMSQPDKGNSAWR